MPLCWRMEGKASDCTARQRCARRAAAAAAAAAVAVDVVAAAIAAAAAAGVVVVAVLDPSRRVFSSKAAGWVGHVCGKCCVSVTATRMRCGGYRRAEQSRIE